ncbi:MAG: glycosyltransferase family 2 protein, partial [Candidatus Dormibacteria bacterium]
MTSNEPDIMKSQPLLSIVIPTHNRAKYAVHAIPSILNNLQGRIELIVHDTSDSNDLEFFVSGILDKRLIYRHTDQKLSMTENHNRAMELARGEYVCLIGDDDNVSPEIQSATEWAKIKGIDVLSPNV